ncbi:MAG: redox-sensing transcriptional repressor Rex [Candidatus Margulisbacteria bacterium]|nr:redox-sensing transcriptional repressor Rex [Candidatus Margulisiibacteriota bacterium]
MKIPEKTVRRLSLYYRCLYFLSQQGAYNLSSKSLADLLELEPAQVRKDLSYFGQFGKKGKGYDVLELKNEIAKILGLEKGRKVAIIGIGNLGNALLSFKGFEVLGFQVVAIFDNSPNKIGKKYHGKICQDISAFPAIVRREKIDIAILTVPTESAQEVARLVSNSGIKAILNFAPAHLNVPKGVAVSNIDLAVELKSLSYFAGQKQ